MIFASLDIERDPPQWSQLMTYFSTWLQVAGSVAALMAQRLVLGLERGVGILRLSPRGPMREAHRPCPRCA